MKFKVLGAALLSCALLLGCEDKAATSVNPAVPVVKVQGKTMGTFYTVTVPGTYEGGEEALRKISEEALGKYFPNTPMLAAIIKVSKIMTDEELLEDMKGSFKHKFAKKPEVIDGNMKALEMALKEVKKI